MPFIKCIWTEGEFLGARIYDNIATFATAIAHT